MEHKTYTQQEIKKIERLRTVIGVIAFLAALYALYNIILGTYHSINSFQYYSNDLSSFYPSNYKIISLISNVLTILNNILLFISMLFCVFFFFNYYGKKKSPYLAVSAFLFAAAQLLLSLSGMISTGNNIYFTVSQHYFTNTDFIAFFVAFILNILPHLVIGLFFILFALSLLDKIKFNAKYLPPIALAITFVLGIISIVSFLILNLINSPDFSYQIFNLSLRKLPTFVLSLLYFIPFALFTIFCPPDYKKATLIPSMDFENNAP